MAAGEKKRKGKKPTLVIHHMADGSTLYNDEIFDYPLPYGTAPFADHDERDPGGAGGTSGQGDRAKGRRKRMTQNHHRILVAARIGWLPQKRTSMKGGLS